MPRHRASGGAPDQSDHPPASWLLSEQGCQLRPVRYGHVRQDKGSGHGTRTQGRAVRRPKVERLFAAQKATRRSAAGVTGAVRNSPRAPARGDNRARCYCGPQGAATMLNSIMCAQVDVSVGAFPHRFVTEARRADVRCSRYVYARASVDPGLRVPVPMWGIGGQLVAGRRTDLRRRHQQPPGA